jgi:hypothetical protein
MVSGGEKVETFKTRALVSVSLFHVPCKLIFAVARSMTRAVPDVVARKASALSDL